MCSYKKLTLTEEFSKDMSRFILDCKDSSNGETPSQLMFLPTIAIDLSVDKCLEELTVKLLFDNIDISNGDNSSTDVSDCPLSIMLVDN